MCVPFIDLRSPSQSHQAFVGREHGRTYTRPLHIETGYILEVVDIQQSSSLVAFSAIY